MTPKRAQQAEHIHHSSLVAAVARLILLTNVVQPRISAAQMLANDRCALVSCLASLAKTMIGKCLALPPSSRVIEHETLAIEATSTPIGRLPGFGKGHAPAPSMSGHHAQRKEVVIRRLISRHGRYLEGWDVHTRASALIAP